MPIRARRDQTGFGCLRKAHLRCCFVSDGARERRCVEELCLGVGVIGVAEKPLPHSDLSSSFSSAPPVSSVCYHSPTATSFVQVCGFPDEIYQALLSIVQSFKVLLRQLSYTIKNQLN